MHKCVLPLTAALLLLAPALASAQADGESGQKIVGVALSQIGKSDRDPGCPELGCYGGKRRDWCSEFVSWAYFKAGSPFDGGKASPWLLADSAKIVAWFQARKRYTDRDHADWKALPVSPGDYVLIGRVSKTGKLTGRRHSGLVEFVDSQGTLHTLEGNNNGRPVGRFVYPAFKTNLNSNGPANGVVLGIGRKN